MRKGVLSFLAFMLLGIMGAGAQSRPTPLPDTAPTSQPRTVPHLFSLHVVPTLNVPLGPYATYYGLGGGGTLGAELRMPFLPLLYLKGDIGYGIDPLKTQSISVLTATAGVGLRLDIARWLSLRAFGSAGVYSGFLNDFSSYVGQTAPVVSGGASLSFSFTPAFAVGVGATYEYCTNLYSGIRPFLSISYTLGAEGKRAPRIQIGDVELADVFPVFCNYYDTNALGSVVVSTDETEPLGDVKVTFFVKQYMDAPKECVAPATLRKGTPQTVQLNALFTSKVLDITEATKAAAEITVHCRWRGEQFSQTKVVSLGIENRNGLTWDDDRKVASFVTAMDPVVLSLTKAAAGVVREQRVWGTSVNLLTAMAIHEALRAYGVAYVVDPESSYASLSAQAAELDYVQFPRQTLEYKAGDCDDLSILYCALLESVGVETAFLTIPGHIFMAFSVGMEPAEAARSFSRPDDLIYRDGTTWVPIEITSRNENFLQAWEIGAREWREHMSKNDGALLPVREAWKVYRPVGFPSSGGTVALPSAERISAAYAAESARFVDREVSARETEIRTLLAARPNDPALLNRLGIVYGTFGQLDKAVASFQGLIQRQEYVPALVNLGNTLYLQGNAEGALELYQRAAQTEPGNSYALLGMARTYRELGRSAESRAAYTKVKEANPWLAEQYTYLETQAER